VSAAALKAVLRAFLDDAVVTAHDLHDRFSRLDVDPCTLHDLDIEVSPRLLDAARWLIEHGTDRNAVRLGLSLLTGHVEPRDVPTLKERGLRSDFAGAAARLLAELPEAAHDLIWLAERTSGRTVDFAVQALLGHPDPNVRSWVRSAPRDRLSSELARKIAQHHRLVELLDEPDDLLWDQTGGLLLAMTSPNNYRSEIGHYPDALAVYRRWVDLAGRQEATVHRAAMLASVAEDLATGPAALVAGAERHGLLDRITAVLSGWIGRLEPSDRVEARRVAWIAAKPIGVPEGRFAVRVVVPDPQPSRFPVVETRIVIDGTPIVAAAFDKGPAEDPALLIERGQLRATGEPREVRLAEAYCTEGCCGGLYVTIVRAGDEVVWKDWRKSKKGDPPGEFRFDASEYDREIARVEQDRGWEWPAKTVARLVAEEFAADPSLLGRWDCRPGWCTSWLQDHEIARITFQHPAEDPVLRFGLLIEVGDRAPEIVAAEVVDSMRNTDPKSVAQVIGGGKDAAEKLGFGYDPSALWW
jgi:hypothetical protein